MAAIQTNITLTHGLEQYQTIVNKLLQPAGSGLYGKEFIALRNFFHAAVGQDRAVKAVVQINSGDAVSAHATVTVLSNAAGDTAVVNGTTFTAVDHREATNVTYGSDSSGSLNSTFFTFQDQTGVYKYYLWFSINNAGVDPKVAGRVGIKIIGATGASAATLATASVTATAGTTSAKITFSADSSGSLNNTYFTVRDQLGQNKCYFWFNINKAGVDPAPAGFAGTGIMVSGATGAAAATLATAAYTAATASNPTVANGFSVVNSSSGVINIYSATGVAPVVQDGTTVATSTQFVMVQALQGVVVTAGASGHAIFTDSAPGVATKVTDGSAATSFTFTRSITGSAISSVQYNIASTDTLAAANLAAAINANAAAGGAMAWVAGATSAAAVVTVTSYFPGPVGNGITLTATTGNTASGATLASGALPTTLSTINTYHAGV